MNPTVSHSTQTVAILAPALTALGLGAHAAAGNVSALIAPALDAISACLAKSDDLSSQNEKRLFVSYGWETGRSIVKTAELTACIAGPYLLAASGAQLAGAIGLTLSLYMIARKVASIASPKLTNLYAGAKKTSEVVEKCEHRIGEKVFEVENECKVVIAHQFSKKPLETSVHSVLILNTLLSLGLFLLTASPLHGASALASSYSLYRATIPTQEMATYTDVHYKTDKRKADGKNVPESYFVVHFSMWRAYSGKPAPSLKEAVPLFKSEEEGWHWRRSEEPMGI